MTLPAVDRVIYKINPLDRVICQLRFPPILKIDNEVPAGFQEQVRSTFPLYAEKVELVREIEFKPQSFEKPLTIQSPERTTSHRNHQFISEDGNWTLNLTRTYLSITTTKYRMWEEFYERFVDPLKALIEVYSPSFFTRIGLRYIDIFARSELGLKESPWTELLQESFLGMLSSTLAEDIKNCESVYDIELDYPQSMLRLKTGFVQHLQLNEQCYLVDSDFFTGGVTQIEKYHEVLDYLHDQSSRLIQMIITKKLHEALKPTKIG
jgi:uncharacterized protein (TIGR04255 family)